MNEQDEREYHSGDPHPEARCDDCGTDLFEMDYETDLTTLATRCWTCATDRWNR